MCACPDLRVLRTETQCRWEVSPLRGTRCQGARAGRSCEHAPSVSLLCCSLCFRVTRAPGCRPRGPEVKREAGEQRETSPSGGLGGVGGSGGQSDCRPPPVSPSACSPSPSRARGPRASLSRERGWSWSFVRTTPHSPVRKLSLFAVLGTQSRNFTLCVHQPSFTSLLSPSQEAQAH